MAVRAFFHRRRGGTGRSGLLVPSCRLAARVKGPALAGPADLVVHGGPVRHRAGRPVPGRNLLGLVFPGPRSPAPASHGRRTTIAGNGRALDSAPSNVWPGDQKTMVDGAALAAVRRDHLPCARLVLLLRGDVRFLPVTTDKCRDAPYGPDGRVQHCVPNGRLSLLVAHGRDRPQPALADGLRGKDRQPGTRCAVRSIPGRSDPATGKPDRLYVLAREHPRRWRLALV